MADYDKEFQELKKRVSNLEKLVRAQQTIISASNLSPYEKKAIAEVDDFVGQPQIEQEVSSPKEYIVDDSIKEKLKDQEPSLEQNLETKIGGTWLNRIGVIAFIIGMGFFLKYAFDNDWVGPTGRIIIGLLVGMGFIIVGEWSQKNAYRIFGQGLTGGGIAILYFSIFAAFNYYQLIGQIPAFGIMILITTGAVLLSVRYNSLAIVILGIIGGFLTPFMLSTGKTNVLALFSYIAILDLGILALAYFKNWRVINILSFVFTQAVILLWLAADFEQTEIWQRQLVLVIFFTIFAFLAFFHNIIHKRQTEPDDLILLGLNAALFFGLSYLNLQDKYHWLLGYFAAFMGLIYFACGYLTLRVNKEDKYLILSFLSIALTFITIAIPIQLQGHWITMAWAVEGLALLWIGFYLDNIKTRKASWLVLAFITFRLLVFDTRNIYISGKAYIPLLNWQGLTFLFGLAAIWGGAYLYARHTRQTSNEEKSLATVLAVLGNILLLFFLSIENSHFYDSLWNQASQDNLNDARQLTLSGIWGIYSIILIVVGIIKRFQPIRIFAIVLFAITILKVFFVDLASLNTIYRIVSFIGLGVILILVSFLYQRYNRQILNLVGPDHIEEDK